MDPIEGLRRQIRVLRRWLIVCALAIVGLATATLLLTRTPSSLSIGRVTIDDAGIAIVDDANQTAVRLRADWISVGSADRGGIALSPGTYVMNDASLKQLIRMQTWHDNSGGVTSLFMESRDHKLGDHGSIQLITTGGPRMAPRSAVEVDAPMAEPARLISETPEPALPLPPVKSSP